MLFNTIKNSACLLTALLLSGVFLLPCAPAEAQGIAVQMTPLEEEIWDDPDFRRRFVESYIAETELEPKPKTAEEVEVINKILELMSPPTREVEEVNDKGEKEKKTVTVEETPEQTSSRLQNALNKALEARSQNETFSVLIDFLIANLYLNISMNLPEPDALADDTTDEQKAAYDARLEAYGKQRDTLLGLAAQYYNNAVIKHPKYRRAWRNLGLVHVRLKDFDAARKAFGKVIMLGGGDPDTYGLLGYCYTSLGEHLPAESAYRMANLLAPEQINWKMGLVRSFLMQKRYPEAVALTGKLLEDDPTNKDLWLFQANAYIGMDQIDKAAENYEILDGLGKSSVDSVALLANIYTNKGLYDTAVKYYGRAIEMAEGDKAAKMLPQLLRSAKVLATRGESARPATKKLIESINTAFKDQMETKDQQELLKIQARIALAEGADAEQARILEEVVKLDPLDGEALILLGQYYASQQQWDDAIFRYERAANIDGFEPNALVYHAKALVDSDRPAQALPLLRRAQSIKPRESVQKYLEAVERMSK